MKVLLVIAYAGQNYYGFQKQSSPVFSTIQGELERVLAKVYRVDIHVKASGRTDRGVHAEDQVITFEDEADFTRKLKVSKLAKILNNYLPQDIRVRRAYFPDEVGKVNFHPRYDGRVRWYRYEMKLYRDGVVMKKGFFNRASFSLPIRKLQNSRFQNQEDSEKEDDYYLNGEEIGVLQNFFDVFLGEHDFTAFASGKDLANNKRRHMQAIEVVVQGSRCRIDLFANAFLREMVRSLVGNVFYNFRLYLLGERSEREVLEKLEKTLESKDPRLAKHRVPAEGLTLKKIFYYSIFGKIG